MQVIDVDTLKLEGKKDSDLFSGHFIFITQVI